MSGYYGKKATEKTVTDLDFILSMIIGFISSIFLGLLIEGYDETFPVSILYPSYFLGAVTLIGEISAILLFGGNFAWPILLTSWGSIPLSCNIASWIYKIAIGH